MINELTFYGAPPMNADEARQAIVEIDATLTVAYLKIWEFKKRRGYAVLKYQNLADCIRTECPNFAAYSKPRIYQFAAAGEVLDNLQDSLQFVESAVSEGQLRPIVQAKLPPEEQREVFQQAIDTCPNGRLTAEHVQQTIDAYRQEHEATVQPLVEHKKRTMVAYSVSDWNGLSEHEQAALLETSGEGYFNATNDNVEWARWTWNPITGCLHNCPYCYARDIAVRRYNHLPDGEHFSPYFYPDRLVMPTNTRAPDVSQVPDPVRRIGLRSVFVCSMADLFGSWVPADWIEAVLQQAWDNPQWNFLFLTKFPIRMAEFEYPPNAWIGTTVDRQYAVERAEKAFTKIRNSGYAGIAWLSCEPMLERLTFSRLDMFDWVVIGGASESSQTPEYFPPIRDTFHLVIQADKYDIPIYMKTNLGIRDKSRIREYPWE